MTRTEAQTWATHLLGTEAWLETIGRIARKAAWLGRAQSGGPSEGDNRSFRKAGKGLAGNLGKGTAFGLPEGTEVRRSMTVDTPSDTAGDVAAEVLASLLRSGGTSACYGCPYREETPSAVKLARVSWEDFCGIGEGYRKAVSRTEEVVLPVSDCLGNCLVGKRDATHLASRSVRATRETADAGDGNAKVRRTTREGAARCALLGLAKARSHSALRTVLFGNARRTAGQKREVEENAVRVSRTVPVDTEALARVDTETFARAVYAAILARRADTREALTAIAVRHVRDAEVPSSAEVRALIGTSESSALRLWHAYRQCVARAAGTRDATHLERIREARNARARRLVDGILTRAGEGARRRAEETVRALAR